MVAHRTKMARFNRLITYDEAVMKLKSVHWNKVQVKSIPVHASNKMISASTVISEAKVPSFNRSAVDGYAVISSDVSGSSEFNPAILKIAGEIEAGQSKGLFLERGHAYEIYTGGEIPENADAVVMAEDASRKGDIVDIFRSVRKFENVSRAGEDIDAGQELIHEGELIRPQHIASLIAAGVREVVVYGRIRMGIISTGNEIIPGKGTVINTTQPLLLNYFSTGYIETVDSGVVPDDAGILSGKIKDKLNQGLNVLVITGGSSLGAMDIVPDALENIGNLVFGGVMIKPGRTISLYEVGGIPVFSVSGLPVAALISLDAFLNEFLSHMLDFRNPGIKVKARLTERVANRDAKRSYLRVMLRNTESGLVAEPLRITGSGILSSILKANGIVIIPENVEGLEEGEIVVISVIGSVY